MEEVLWRHSKLGVWVCSLLIHPTWLKVYTIGDVFLKGLTSDPEPLRQWTHPLKSAERHSRFFIFTGEEFQ